MTVFAVIGGTISVILFGIIVYVGTLPLRRAVVHYRTTLDELGKLFAREFPRAKSSIRVYAKNLNPLCWDEVVAPLAKILEKPNVTVRFLVFKPPERTTGQTDNPICILGHEYADEDPEHPENFIKITETEPGVQFVVIDESVLIMVEPLTVAEARGLSEEKREALVNGINYDVVRRVTVRRADYSLASRIVASVDTFDNVWESLPPRLNPPRSAKQEQSEEKEKAMQGVKKAGLAQEVPDGEPVPVPVPAI